MLLNCGVGELSRVPWTTRRSNQSILKEITPGCSLKELMLELKLQYFVHLMWRADSFEKTLMLGKIEDRRIRGWQRMRWLDVITDLMDKGLSSQGYGFSSSHVWMWELNYKESWVLKNWYFWTVVLEKTLESPLDFKDIQAVHPKESQSWLFIARTDAEAETPILWPPDVKNWLIWKDPDAGKDWRWKEKGMTEDEMVGWHHWHNGHEFQQALGGSEGQGSLASCNSWVGKESDMT